MWLEALEAKFGNPTCSKKQFGRAEVEKLLGDNGAVTDAPCTVFWKELVEAYPEAKVVLAERDEDKWLQSTRTLATGVLNPVGRYVLRFTDPGRFGRIINLGIAWIKCWFRVSRSISVDKVMRNAKATYRDHYAEIRATVPRERLLENRLGSGWEPRCKFLGKEVPHTLIPHVNDAAVLDRAFVALIKGALVRSLRNLAVISATGILFVGTARHVLKRCYTGSALSSDKSRFSSFALTRAYAPRLR